MTERAVLADASFSGETPETERISREDIAYIVAFWNRDNPKADPAAERGVEITLVTERMFEELKRSIEVTSFLTDETRVEMQEAARRDYELRRAQDDEYIEDVNRWLEQHPDQVSIVTPGTAHSVTGVVNHNGWLAPCVLDGKIVHRELIEYAWLRSDKA